MTLTLLLACLLLLPGVAPAQDLNLDFETSDGDRKPAAWFLGGQGYDTSLDDKEVKSGKLSLRMTKDGRGQGFAVATSSLPVAIARGRTVKLGGEIKADGVAAGYAGLW